MDRFLTKPILAFVSVLALALAIFGGLQTVRLAWEQAAHASTKGKTLEVLTEISTKTRAAEVAAQRARDTYVLNSAENAIKHAQGVTDAFEKGIAAGRSILSGDSRLQEHWRGCPAGDAGRNAADESRDKALAQRRAESAGRIVGIGAGADNDYALVFDELLNTRQLLSQCYEKKPQ